MGLPHISDNSSVAQMEVSGEIPRKLLGLQLEKEKGCKPMLIALDS